MRRLATMCQVLKVERSGFYAWLEQPRSTRGRTLHVRNCIHTRSCTVIRICKVDFEAVSDVLIRRADPDEINVLTAIDDDAAMLFMQAGIDVDFPPDHEFLIHERFRLSLTVTSGTALLATDHAREPVGFVALGWLDGGAYIEQLSVRMQAMRRGIGTLLLNAVSALAKANGGWTISLTTYGHLPWNRPFYERNGYTVVPETACGVEIARELEIQRRWLPRPDQRVAMSKSLGSA